MVSTNNFAAYIAATNLRYIQQQMNASTYRLSSMNAIFQASDDPAGLAIGTQLASQEATARAALTNIAQGQSMLGIASGAYTQISSLLQTQLSLATQATAGGLTAAQLSALNTQFQSISSQIDQIANNTNFNGLKLTDGSLYTPSPLQSGVLSNATAASGNLTINNAISNGAVYHVFINGASIPFASSANMATLTGDMSMVAVDTTTNTTQAQQASALNNAISNALNYSGTDANVIAIKQQLSQLSYSYTAGNSYVTMTAKVAGTIGNGSASGSTFSAGADTGTAADVLVNGGNASARTVSTSVGIGYNGAGYSPLSVAINGNLNGGTFPSAGTAYNATATTIAQGTVGDSILNSLNTTSQATTGIDASQISNNSSFLGTIQGFTASYVNPNVINASVTVGGVTYQATNVNTNFAANTKVTFSSSTAGAGSFTLNFAANNISVASQVDADTIANRLNSAFSTVTFEQNRSITNYTGSGLIYGAGTTSPATGDLSGSSFKLIGPSFGNLQVQDVQISAPPVGGTSPTISIKINGETYVSGYDSTGSVSALGSSLAAGYYGFVNQSDSKQILVMHYTSSTALDLSTTANAQAAQKALQTAFNMNAGASQITIPVGTNIGNTVPIQLQGAQTSKLYVDSNGNSQSLDLLSSSNATTAFNTITDAINTISGYLASVGSQQSVLTSSTTNLNTTIQNLDSARGNFLDTNVAEESTNLAKTQLMQESAIAVLAQANVASKSYLKLLQA
jgi:flagellin